MKVLQIGLGIIPAIIGEGIDIYNHLKEKNNKNEKKKLVDYALKEQIKEFNEQQSEARKKQESYKEKIENLELLIKSNLEEIYRLECEKEKDILKQEQEEEEKRIEKIEKEKEAIEICRQSLSNEFLESIADIENNFFKEEEKWINSLNVPEVEEKIKILKDELDNLFDQLFELENIMNKMNNRFIKTVKDSIKDYDLEKMNFIIIGKSGSGKSTLINEIFGEKMAKEGKGTRQTTEITKYESKLVPFLAITDTMGTEIGSEHKLVDVLEVTLGQLTKQLDSKNPNDHFHCIIYCTTSNRFVKDELKVILKLREKYDGKKLPIVIAYTQAIDNDDVEAIKSTINNFLQEHGESLSDDIFGITYTDVLAREIEEIKYGQKRITPCFGLAKLMSICFKKGEKSYKFSLKTALVQIGKNSIKEYLENTHARLINNIDYFKYLSHQFEPNFADYIAFCFDKITDIDEQKGIKGQDLYRLQNYLNNHQIEGIKDLSKIQCMFCDKTPKNPLRCKYCESEICESCYINYYENNEGSIQCKNCEQEEFEKVEKKEQFNEIQVDEDININIKNKIDGFKEEYLYYDYNQIYQNEINEEQYYEGGNNIKYKEDEIEEEINYDKAEEKYNKILTNNLKQRTLEAIKRYTEKVKLELLNILNKKFNSFAEKSAEDIYNKILEKFIEKVQNNEDDDINLVGAMEKKEELKKCAILKLNSKLKEGAQKRFLAEVASQLFQDIVNKFQDKCKAKLDEYIDNLLNNKDAQNLFLYSDELNEKKGLKFEKELKEYLKTLEEKEKKSKQKALGQIKANKEEIEGSSSISDSCRSNKI